MPRCFEVEQLDQDLGVMRLVKSVRTDEALRNNRGGNAHTRH